MLSVVFLNHFKPLLHTSAFAGVGISRTTAKWRKLVSSSHPAPFAVVASSGKSQTKVGTLACFSFLYQNELTM